jgi:hypothetical protein
MGLMLRRTLTCSLLVILVSILWLFSPPPKRAGDFCGRYVSINSEMGFVVNCDAGTYAYPAASPARLLRKEEVRQSRPLYVLMGTIVGYPLSALARIVDPGIDPRAPFHIGFAILNFMILTASVLLFDSLLSRAGVDRLVIAPLAVFLVANDVTRAFVWTAHQQMFSIFTPVVSLDMFRRVGDAPASPRARLWALALGLGFLPLVYGNFVIVLPVLLLADAWSRRRPGTEIAAGSISRYGPAIVAFFVPTLAWMALVTWIAGSYYNHEMQVYRQLVWVADAAQTGVPGFVGQVARNTRAFGATFLSAEMLPLLGACMLFLVRRPTGGSADSRGPGVGDPVRAGMLARGSVVVAACFFLFLWVLGYYQPRLTYSLVPPALCLAALGLSRIAGNDRVALRRTAWIVAPLACVWIAYHVMKYGPFG